MQYLLLELFISIRRLQRKAIQSLGGAPSCWTDLNLFGAIHAAESPSLLACSVCIRRTVPIIRGECAGHLHLLVGLVNIAKGRCDICESRSFGSRWWLRVAASRELLTGPEGGQAMDWDHVANMALTTEFRVDEDVEYERTYIWDLSAGGLRCRPLAVV